MTDYFNPKATQDSDSDANLMIDAWLLTRFWDRKIDNFRRSLDGKPPSEDHTGVITEEAKRLFKISSDELIGSLVAQARKTIDMRWSNLRKKINTWAVELGLPAEFLFREYLDGTIEDLDNARRSLSFALRICDAAGVGKDLRRYIVKCKEWEEHKRERFRRVHHEREERAKRRSQGEE
jgi:hypothetical protein